MSSNDIYIGLMSGTSLDAVDAVAVSFKQQRFNLIGTYSQPMPDLLKKAILNLSSGTGDSLQLLAESDHQLGKLYASTSLRLMEKFDLRSSQIEAIGCHGQTIRHVPPGQGKVPFSVQIGDANLLAIDTDTPVVADFRRKDIALGGQGAPLVPAFHRQFFSSIEKTRVILNIGGIANITYLPIQGECQGFDTGPGNMLMDVWSQIHLSTAYDHNGKWAAGGSVQKKLLDRLKRCDFFSRPAPKSTGRELFNRHWLETQLSNYNHVPPQDIQATLLALSAETITEAINTLVEPVQEVFVCGGGAMNISLMDAIGRLLPKAALSTTDTLGLGPNWVEACAFAWLAKQRMEHKTGNLTEVTGASREAVLGALYLP